MNWRRGLFRLWIVGTVLFVIAVAFVSYSEIKQQFDDVALMHVLEADELAVPVLCADARGSSDGSTPNTMTYRITNSHGSSMMFVGSLPPASFRALGRHLGHGQVSHSAFR